MSKHNKNRPQNANGRAKSRGEQLLDDVDRTASRMGEDVHQGGNNMRERGERAVTDVKAKARNKR